MYCRHCGRLIEDGSDFCPICGNEQPEKTPSDYYAPTDDAQAKTKLKANSKAFRLTVCIAACAALLAAAAAGALWLFRWKPDTALPPPSPALQISDNEKERMEASALTLYVYDEDFYLICRSTGFAAFDSSTVITNYKTIRQGCYIKAVDQNGIARFADGLYYYSLDEKIAAVHFPNPLTCRCLKQMSRL